ncbi:MAG: hypothetical protein AAFU72_04415 [Pseudomonadota bacterium]
MFEFNPNTLTRPQANRLERISERFGTETFATSAEARGSMFSDLIVAGPGTEQTEAGMGRDVLVGTLGAGVVHDGGRGADTFVLTVEPGRDSAEIEECLIFDFGSAGLQSRTTETILLPDFSPESLVADLGGGRVEVVDADGTVARLHVMERDGTPVAFDVIREAIAFGDTGEDVDVGPILIIAEDVEGAAVSTTASRDHVLLARQVQVADVDLGRGDDFFAFIGEAPSDDDAALTLRVDLGRGDDLMMLDLRGALPGTEIAIVSGLGDDTIVFRRDAATPEIEECLIFDLDGAGLQARAAGTTSVLLPDFGPETAILDLGDGLLQIADTSRDLVQTLQLEDGRGVGLAIGFDVAVEGAYDVDANQFEIEIFLS